jgi:DNA-binding transcriptional LysR family regulator
MDYNRVAHFVRVARAGSFTAAATEAGLPKSSLSRSIARLEDELGVRLLQRTTRKLALTEAGQAYYEAVAPSVGAIDQADAAAREHDGSPRGLVRLSAPPDLAGLPETLVELGRRHPGVRVEVSVTAREVDLVAEGFDLAVRAGRLEDSSLVGRRVGPTELGVVASPRYLRRRGRPQRPAELAQHEWVLYRASGGHATLRLGGPDGEHVVEVTGALVGDDLGFCRSAAEAGAGLALLPIHTVAHAFVARRLEHVLPAWTSGGASLYVLLPSAQKVPARVALVRDLLVERLGARLRETERRCRAARAVVRAGE